MKQEKKPKNPRKILYYSLLCFFSAVFLFSAIYLISYFVQSNEAASQYDDLASQLEQLRATAPSRPPLTIPPTPATDPSTGETIPPVTTDPATPTTPIQPTEPGEHTILPEYLPFYEMNNDVVGWITIPDTKIDYPVLQTPNNPDYYLKRNFYKQSSDWGAIYAREVCDIHKPSDNITLYGHHMKDGSMFASLNKYWDWNYWKDHQAFIFDTLYERHTYQIFAVFKTSANEGQGYPYHRFSDAATEQEFNDFVSNVKQLSFYDTGITPKYGDKLLTLSTCEYTLSNGRFVVCAVRIS